MNNTVFKTLSMIVTAAMIAAFIAIVCITSKTTKKPEDTLVVGMMSGWAPFMTINQKGVFEGFDVDVAQELANRLNKKLVIQDLGSLASCFIALDQNKIDLLLSGLDVTEQRLEKYAMVRYTGQDVTSFELVFWNDIPKGITGMQDLRNIPNAIVCAEPGSAQEKFLDQYSFVIKKSLNSVTDIILDLKFGKSLAAVLEPRVAARFKKQYPEIKTLTVALPKNFQVYGCGIALKKNNHALITSTAAIIQAMRQQGVLKQLEQKWQLEE